MMDARRVELTKKYMEMKNKDKDEKQKRIDILKDLRGFFYKKIIV